MRARRKRKDVSRSRKAAGAAGLLTAISMLLRLFGVDLGPVEPVADVLLDGIEGAIILSKEF